MLACLATACNMSCMDAPPLAATVITVQNITLNFKFAFTPWDCCLVNQLKLQNAHYIYERAACISLCESVTLLFFYSVP